jgi:Rab-GTPase-TBC domain
MHTVKPNTSSNTSLCHRSQSSADLLSSASANGIEKGIPSSQSRMKPVSNDERRARVTSLTAAIPTLEQCLLGEESVFVQRQLHQQNYANWFGPIETRERQLSDNSISSYGSSSSNMDRSSINDFKEVSLDDIDTDKVEETALFVDPERGIKMNAPSNSFDFLQDFAPVSSKWSECVPLTSDDVGEGVSNRINQDPHQIDLAVLRKIVSTGCGMDDDDENDDIIGGDGNPPMSRTSSKTNKGCRAMAWRVLLGYLPTDTSQWFMDKDSASDSKCTLQQKRELYVSLASDLFTNVSDITVAPLANELRGRRKAAADARRRMKRSNHSTSDSGNTTSSLTTVPVCIQRYWEEKALDVDILQRSLLGSSDEFNTLRIDEEQFSVDSTSNNNSDHGIDSNSERNMNDLVENVLLLDEIHKDVIRTHPDLAFFLDPYQNVGKRRYAALERILFVWSKYNKGVRYVQGMNEIVGILYYVVANDLNDEWAIWAEADTYWLLNSLLGDMRDVFISGFDEHDTGIQGRLMAMQALLHRHDPEVAEHLQDLGIEISFYAIRWWTTLLCREFLLPDTIRLWDSMFASTHKDNFLRYICVTMVMSLRDRLLKGDFTTCLQLLHSFPPTSIEYLLQASRALWIYESQISVACHRGGLTLHQALTTIESPKALIIGFGFVNGTPPVGMGSSKEVVGEIKGATVKIEATVRRSANELLGRARGWYSRYNLNKDQATKNFDPKMAPTVTKHEDPRFCEEDDVYLQAISNS